MKNYRLLQAGEIIEQGDEIKNGLGDWCLCKALVGEKWNPGVMIKAEVRRILSTQK